MKSLVLFLLLLVGSAAHGFYYLDSDFANSEFSIKGKALDYAYAPQELLDGTAYIVQVEVLDVYHGNLTVGDKFELHVMSDDMLKSMYRDDILEGEFATNFCLSNSGVYFTDKLYKPKQKTIAALESYRQEGTENWDRHDCYDLRGSSMDPDSLDYSKPIPSYGGNHSAKYWVRQVPFMAAYNEAIKKTVNPEWVTEFEGKGRSRDTYTLDGTQWLHISFCDLAECRLHNMSILYNEANSQLMALVADSATYFVGDPSDSAKSLLLSLHDDLFSSKGSIEKRLYNPGYYKKILASEKKRRENISTTQKLIGTLIDIYIED